MCVRGQQERGKILHVWEPREERKNGISSTCIASSSLLFLWHGERGKGISLSTTQTFPQIRWGKGRKGKIFSKKWKVPSIYKNFLLTEKRFQLRFLNVASHFCSKNTCIENKSIQLRTTRPLPFQDLNASHHLVLTKKMSHTTKVGFFPSPGFPAFLATEQEKSKKNLTGLRILKVQWPKEEKKKRNSPFLFLAAGFQPHPRHFPTYPRNGKAFLLESEEEQEQTLFKRSVAGFDKVLIIW